MSDSLYELAMDSLRNAVALHEEAIRLYRIALDRSHELIEDLVTQIHDLHDPAPDDKWEHCPLAPCIQVHKYMEDNDYEFRMAMERGQDRAAGH